MAHILSGLRNTPANDRPPLSTNSSDQHLHHPLVETWLLLSSTTGEVERLRRMSGDELGDLIVRHARMEMQPRLLVLLDRSMRSGREILQEGLRPEHASLSHYCWSKAAVSATGLIGSPVHL